MFFNADVRLADPELFFRRMGSIICDESVSAATCNVLIYPEEEGTIDRLFHRFFNWYCRFLNEIGMGMGRGECHVIRAERFRRIGGGITKKAFRVLFLYAMPVCAQCRGAFALDLDDAESTVRTHLRIREHLRLLFVISLLTR